MIRRQEVPHGGINIARSIDCNVVTTIQAPYMITGKWPKRFNAYDVISCAALAICCAPSGDAIDSWRLPRVLILEWWVHKRFGSNSHLDSTTIVYVILQHCLMTFLALARWAPHSHAISRHTSKDSFSNLEFYPASSSRTWYILMVQVELIQYLWCLFCLVLLLNSQTLGRVSQQAVRNP